MKIAELATVIISLAPSRGVYFKLFPSSAVLFQLQSLTTTNDGDEARRGHMCRAYHKGNTLNVPPQYMEKIKLQE